MMEMALQGEFDGVDGTDDLTIPEIGELLREDRDSVAQAIARIKKKTGYIVPYVKMKGGRRSE
ncbi:MAG: hypothetical protein K2L38_01585 [Dysosmobacter sp.]|nr:hypothetical protein [Dysosmobacter sp.]